MISRTREAGDVARDATAALCRLYWNPLYTYVRRAGQPSHEAEDTVQEFLAHVVESGAFSRADADRGRFRTFLLAALRQFMARRHRDQHRQKRTPAGGVVSFDFAQAEETLDRTRDASPDSAFDRAWAMTQLDLAWQRLVTEYETAGKGTLVRHLRPVVAGQVALAVKDLAAALGMTEGAVNVATHRLRKRFGEVLREQVASTLSSDAEVDDEIRNLRQALAGPPR
jgi:RNA polymerase sigma-70 factor (ECF subfamily)